MIVQRGICSSGEEVNPTNMCLHQVRKLETIPRRSQHGAPTNLRLRYEKQQQLEPNKVGNLRNTSSICVS